MDPTCSHCHKPLEENALFCAYCGTSVAAQAENMPSAPVEVRPAAPKERPCRSGPHRPEKSALAFCVAGFVCGLFSVFCAILPHFALFSAVLGIVFSAYGVRKTCAGNGRGFAIAGLTLSIVGCLFAFFAMLIWFFELLAFSDFDYDPFYYYDYSDFVI